MSAKVLSSKDEVPGRRVELAVDGLGGGGSRADEVAGDLVAVDGF